MMNRPLSSAAAKRRSPSFTLVVKGFSHNTCFPFKTCHTVLIMHVVGSRHIDRVHLLVSEKLLIRTVCPGNSVFLSECLCLFREREPQAANRSSPLHTVYCFSELCRYGAGCQDCPIHKRCLQLFYLLKIFNQIYPQASPIQYLTLHLMLFPVHVSVCPGQRAFQAHILTGSKKA